MGNSKEYYVNRIAAGIMAILMLAFVVFSAVFIAEETDHDCCGEDCPVCACIRLIENAQRQLGTGAPVSFPYILPVLFISLTAVLSFTAVLKTTLVSQKVRMDD